MTEQPDAGLPDAGLPTARTVAEAGQRIAPHVRRTPTMRAAGSLGVPADLHLKLELLQHTGSFKPRGAFNLVLSVGDDVPAAGLVAASGGNHGQAVAWVGRRLGLATEVFVPGVTPAVKRNRIAAYGADVRVVGEMYDDAQQAADARAVETGALLVHPFDRPEIVAGQATVGAEIAEQVDGADTVIVAVGGGGLLAGVAAALGDRVRLIGVEPAGCASLRAGLDAGRPVRVDVAGVAADSLGSRTIGRLSLAAAQRWLDELVLVTDDEIRSAQRALWEELRLVAEPGGAAALAGARSAGLSLGADERVVVILCGANTDPSAVAAPVGAA